MSTPPILHLAWPPQVTEHPDGSRTIDEVPQDSAHDIEGAALLLSTVRRGELPLSPDVGVTDPLGANDPAAAGALIQSDLRRLEPRPAQGIRVEVVPQPDGNRKIRLKVNL